MEPEGHWSLRVTDNIAGLGDIHVENSFPIESSGDGPGAEGRDEPSKRDR